MAYLSRNSHARLFHPSHVLSGVLALTAFIASACGESDTSDDRQGSGGASGSAGAGGASGSAGAGGSAGKAGSSGSAGVGGSAGTAGAGGGGVDLDELGKPCVQDKCPAGLTPVKYCGIAGCNPEFCSCEIPCDRGPAVCPPGTTCAHISDGPGNVCVKS